MEFERLAKARVFDAENYRAAGENYDERWKLLDSALYRVCSEHPDHSDIAAVTAKVFLIGRTYQTGIERQMESDGRQAGTLKVLAEHLRENAQVVDGIIGAVRRVAGWDDPEATQQVARAHEGLLMIVIPLMRTNRTPRSFVSKYLHFHAPIVPIYDVLSAKAVRKLVPPSAQMLPRPEGERVYIDFLRRFVAVAAGATAAGVAVTSKGLDHYLLSLE